MPLAGETIIAGKLPGERIATDIQTTDSASIGATETVVATVVAALVSGRTYRVTADFAYKVGVTTDRHFARIREDNLTGTEIQGRRFDAASSDQLYPLHLEAEYTAVSTGNKTFVVTFIRSGGTGTAFRNALSTNPGYFYVDYIRG